MRVVEHNLMLNAAKRKQIVRTIVIYNTTEGQHRLITEYALISLLMSVYLSGLIAAIRINQANVSILVETRKMVNYARTW